MTAVTIIATAKTAVMMIAAPMIVARKIAVLTTVTMGPTVGTNGPVTKDATPHGTASTDPLLTLRLLQSRQRH